MCSGLQSLNGRRGHVRLQEAKQRRGRTRPVSVTVSPLLSRGWGPVLWLDPRQRHSLHGCSASKGASLPKVLCLQRQGGCQSQRQPLLCPRDLQRWEKSRLEPPPAPSWPHLGQHTSSPGATPARSGDVSVNSTKPAFCYHYCHYYYYFQAFLHHKEGESCPKPRSVPRGGSRGVQGGGCPLSPEQTPPPCQPSGVTRPSVFVPAHRPTAASLVLSKPPRAAERAFVCLPPWCHAPF